MSWRGLDPVREQEAQAQAVERVEKNAEIEGEGSQDHATDAEPPLKLGKTRLAIATDKQVVDVVECGECPR